MLSLKNGVLFVNGTTVSKGDAFLSFLRKTGFSPDKIIFIDDREDNLISLEAAIQKLGRPVEYWGLHFLGAQKYLSTMISEDEFESRWQQLAVQARLLD
jgi:FMN phosphatase YigB (HAD superfamily)